MSCSFANWRNVKLAMSNRAARSVRETYTCWRNPAFLAFYAQSAPQVLEVRLLKERLFNLASKIVVAWIADDTARKNRLRITQGLGQNVFDTQRSI